MNKVINRSLHLVMHGIFSQGQFLRYSEISTCVLVNTCRTQNPKSKGCELSSSPARPALRPTCSEPGQITSPSLFR